MAIFQKIKADPAFKGDKGDPGTPADVDDITRQVIAKLPLFVLQYTNKDGVVVEETPFVFDPISNRLVAKLGPLTVETYDAAGKFKETESYPLVWPVKLKPILIPAPIPATIPAVKGT